MTNKYTSDNVATLHSVVSKAISNGWRPHDYADKWEFSISPWYSITFMQSENVNRRFESRWTLEELIFNHEFSEALWGNEVVQNPTPVGDNMYRAEDTYIDDKDIIRLKPILNSWQYHLQQMAMAKDRIKYLKDHVK